MQKTTPFATVQAMVLPFDDEVSSEHINGTTYRHDQEDENNKLKELSSVAAIFGRKCSVLVKLVENARLKHAFRGEVIGPIGRFLKIAPGKEQYAELAELAIGSNTLDRFIVTNDHDRKELDKLRRQANCFKEDECGILIFQVKTRHCRRRYEVPPPPAPEIETVASALVVSNSIVFNCLVDNARIDQCALAPSKEISEYHLLSSENGRYKIKGDVITEVMFLPRGDKWVVRNGTISMFSNTKKRASKIIGRVEDARSFPVGAGSGTAAGTLKRGQAAPHRVSWDPAEVSLFEQMIKVEQIREHLKAKQWQILLNDKALWKTPDQKELQSTNPVLMNEAIPHLFLHKMKMVRRIFVTLTPEGREELLNDMTCMG